MSYNRREDLSVYLGPREERETPGSFFAAAAPERPASGIGGIANTRREGGSGGHGMGAGGMTARPAKIHQSLDPLFPAAARSANSIAVLPISSNWGPRLSSAPQAVARMIERVFFLLSHAPAVPRVWRSMNKDLILVREFLSVPLLIVWPLLWPLRRRLIFILHHNVQLAHRRPLDRFALKTLFRTGCSFACLEGMDGVEELGLPPDPTRFLVLPVPVAASGESAAAPIEGAKREAPIGVIGNFRAEKGTDELLEQLLTCRAAGLFGSNILLGCPDAEYRNRWQRRGVETVDTTRDSAYHEALSACRLVVLKYDAASYYYRSSGLIADAAAHRVAVICPDFPIMRRQVTEPASIGLVFREGEDIGARVAESLSGPGISAEAFRRYAEARSEAALTARLDAFIAGRRPKARGAAGPRQEKA